MLSDTWHACENSKACLFAIISELSPDNRKVYSNFRSINQTLSSDERSMFRLCCRVRSMERLGMLSKKKLRILTLFGKTMCARIMTWETSSRDNTRCELFIIIIVRFTFLRF